MWLALVTIFKCVIQSCKFHLQVVQPSLSISETFFLPPQLWYVFELEVEFTLVGALALLGASSVENSRPRSRKEGLSWNSEIATERDKASLSEAWGQRALPCGLCQRGSEHQRRAQLSVTQGPSGAYWFSSANFSENQVSFLTSFNLFFISHALSSPPNR